ncbi:MAG: hypothetical protein QM579_13625 [Desulfovibrio sp.]
MRAWDVEEVNRHRTAAAEAIRQHFPGLKETLDAILTKVHIHCPIRLPLWAMPVNLPKASGSGNRRNRQNLTQTLRRMTRTRIVITKPGAKATHPAQQRVWGMPLTTAILLLKGKTLTILLVHLKRSRLHFPTEPRRY